MLLIFNPLHTAHEQTEVNGQPIPLHGAVGDGHVAFAISQEEMPGWRNKLAEFEIEIESEVHWPNGAVSIYFRDPLGLLIELACYRFEPPTGCTHADVMIEAHRLRTERGDHNIAEIHLADAIESLISHRASSLSRDRGPADPY